MFSKMQEVRVLDMTQDLFLQRNIISTVSTIIIVIVFDLSLHIQKGRQFHVLLRVGGLSGIHLSMQYTQALQRLLINVYIETQGVPEKANAFLFDDMPGHIAVFELGKIFALGYDAFEFDDLTVFGAFDGGLAVYGSGVVGVGAASDEGVFFF